MSFPKCETLSHKLIWSYYFEILKCDDPLEMQFYHMQTQYDLDTVRISERSNQHETISVTIPVRDRNLLKEIARKFGWACML